MTEHARSSGARATQYGRRTGTVSVRHLSGPTGRLIPDQGVVLALAQQDPDHRGVPVGSRQPAVDDRDVRAGLTDVRRVEPVDPELD